MHWNAMRNTILGGCLEKDNVAGDGLFLWRRDDMLLVDPIHVSVVE